MTNAGKQRNLAGLHDPPQKKRQQGYVAKKQKKERLGKNQQKEPLFRDMQIG